MKGNNFPLLLNMNWMLMAFILTVFNGTVAFAGESSSAARHGVVLGTTWDIIEVDMLTFIENRIRDMQQNGQMDVVQNQFQNRVREKVSRPDPVSGVHRTISPRTHYYDPSVLVTDDLMDSNGRVFAKAGERINPLSIHKPSTWLVFLNGDDRQQVAWVDNFIKQHPNKIKLILTAGSVSDMSGHFHQPIYFDQAGKLTTRLEIHQIPAIVSSESDHVCIDGDDCVRSSEHSGVRERLRIDEVSL